MAGNEAASAGAVETIRVLRARKSVKGCDCLSEQSERVSQPSDFREQHPMVSCTEDSSRTTAMSFRRGMIA